MKNLTINSTIRNLFSLAIYHHGEFVDSAGRIHSVAAAGDWNIMSFSLGEYHVSY
jgi:hypothetical protein